MNTRHLLQTSALLLLFSAERSSWAGQEVAIGYTGLPSRSAQGVQTGIQVSDSVLMHTGIGIEAGYDSNVFYSESDPKSAPLMRVLPFIELTNATRGGLAPAGVYFNLNAALVYREYLSEDQFVSDQRAFMPSASGLIEFSSNQTLSLSIADTFLRTEEPPYVPNGAPIIRNMNMAAAQIRWAPGGGRLQSMLRYTNTYDNFQTPMLTLPDSLAHELMLDQSWRWLPKTAVFLLVAQGYITYLNDSPMDPKSDSYPLRVLLGIRGLVTQKLSANIAAGYANAFYKEGPTTDGVIGRITATAELGYRPTILNTATLGYRHDFQNSLLGNFFYLDSVYGSYQQQIAGRVGAFLSARYEHRRYQISGIEPRTDDFFQLGAAVDYHPKTWFYAGVGYSLILNESDASDAGGTSGADYVKHQIFARTGVTY